MANGVEYCNIGGVLVPASAQREINSLKEERLKLQATNKEQLEEIRFYKQVNKGQERALEKGQNPKTEAILKGQADQLRNVKRKKHEL